MARLITNSFFFLLVFFACFIPAKAQLSYGGHLHAVSYLGNLKEYYQGGYGVSAQVEYAFSDKISGVARTGFLYVPNDLELGILVFLIPFQIGAKYMLNDNFYAQGMIGAYQVNAVATFGSGSGTNFNIGAGVGAHLGRIDIAPHLDFVGNGWSQVGIRLGYRIEK